MAISQAVVKKAYDNAQAAIARALTLQIGDRIAILDYRTGKTMAFATIKKITGRRRYPRYPMMRRFWPDQIDMTSFGLWRLKHPEYRGGDNPRLWPRGFEHGHFGQGFDSANLRLVDKRARG